MKILASTWLACHPGGTYITGQKPLSFCISYLGWQKLRLAKFVAKFEKPRNLTHANAFTSMHRPTRDQNQFLIDNNWKDIQHCIIIIYMQWHCNMIIARTNSWIASTTLSAIVFEIDFEFGRRSQRCYTFGGCQKFHHTFCG